MSLFTSGISMQTAEELAIETMAEEEVETVDAVTDSPNEVDAAIAQDTVSQVVIEEELAAAPETIEALEVTIEVVTRDAEEDGISEGAAASMQSMAAALLGRSGVTLQTNEMSTQSFASKTGRRQNAVLTQQSIVQGVKDFIKKIIAKIKHWIARGIEATKNLMLKADSTGKKLKALKEKLPSLKAATDVKDVAGGRSTDMLVIGGNYKPAGALAAAKNAAGMVSKASETSSAAIKSTIETAEGKVGEMIKAIGTTGLMAELKDSIDPNKFKLKAAPTGTKWIAKKSLPGDFVIAALVPDGSVDDMTVVGAVTIQVAKEIANKVERKTVPALSKEEMQAQVDIAIETTEAVRKVREKLNASYKVQEEITKVLEGLASKADDKVARTQAVKAQRVSNALISTQAQPARMLATIAADTVGAWYKVAADSFNATSKAAKKEENVAEDKKDQSVPFELVS